MALVDSDIDDNPALKTADISLSIDTSTDIAGHPANVLILGSDFTLLRWLLQHAKSSHRKLLMTELGTFFLGTTIAVGAFTGFILPPLAALVSFTWAILALHFTSLRKMD